MTAYNFSSTSIKVHWGSIPAHLQNGIILGYDVIIMLNSGVIRNLNASSNTSEMIVTNLQKYTTYQVCLSGFTIIGSGVQSTPLNVTTDEDGNYLFSPLSTSHLKQERITLKRLNSIRRSRLFSTNRIYSFSLVQSTCKLILRTATKNLAIQHGSVRVVQYCPFDTSRKTAFTSCTS